jgi:hypothetical protein
MRRISTKALAVPPPALLRAVSRMAAREESQFSLRQTSNFNLQPWLLRLLLLSAALWPLAAAPAARLPCARLPSG